jgi:hypothetical protein
MLKGFRGFLFGSSIGLLVLPFMFFMPVSHGTEYPTKTVQIINPFPPGAAPGPGRILFRNLPMP